MRAPGGRGRGRGGVPCAAVARWSHTPVVHPTQYPAHPVLGTGTGAGQLAYPYDPEINDRLAIWQGDITDLEVDAVTNTTDSSLLESNQVSDRILSAAGAGLKEEIVTRGLECHTGEVVSTSGFDLRARHILHTVAPNYVPNYHSAAEGALHNCYRNVLYRSQELGAKSLALCVISSSRKNFPPDLAAHVALRTIRRYLEQNSRPQLVILASSCGPTIALLTALAHNYFPLSAASQAVTLNMNVEDCADRRIRIIHNPHSNSDSAEDEAYSESPAAAEAAAVFADTTRLLAPDTRPLPHLQDHHQYERLLRRARSEDLSEVSGIGCLYQSGVDRLGRPVVIFIGKWFPIGDIDLDKALLYLIKLLDPIVRGDYVIAYFHTLASSTNHPPFSWLKEVYTVLPYKYKKNLKAFYIVHPTFWTKMMTWWFTTFMAPAIKAKVHNLPGVEYLYSVMARDQLEVPAFVTEYDMTINGLHYFQPDASNT